MKKIIRTLISLIVIFMLLPVAQAASQEEITFKEAKQYVDIYNKNLSYVPDIVKTLLKDERLNIYVDNQVVGVVAKDGAVAEFIDEKLSKPTVNVYTSQKIIQDIKESSDPINAAKIAWKSEEITLQGVTFRSKIKLLFIKALLNRFL